jgi:hypothetical protein
MDRKINTNVLCVLTKTESSLELQLDYVEIENPLTVPLRSLTAICDSVTSNTDGLKNFIINTHELDRLDNYYAYCEDIKAPYQGFNFSKASILKEINDREYVMLMNESKYPETFDREKEVSDLKKEVFKKYILACHACAIGKTYRLCHDRKDILTFSHRICGWSNPVYQLAPEFSVELKTNFGYGHSSYFFTKIKYKDIDICPVSEWINYEFAHFSEIVRYSLKLRLVHEDWIEAMNYAKDACNLALSDEDQFVSKYILDECEDMVKGLEDLFLKNKFSFYDLNKRRYEVDKRGHVLVAYRGEKISGAIDFISKILELERIAEISSYIKRIRECNKKIQPILSQEMVLIKKEIIEVEQDIKGQQPEYDNVKEKIKGYAYKQDKIKRELISAGKMSWKEIDTELIHNEFSLRYPEYDEFLLYHNKINENYTKTTEHLSNLEGVLHQIAFYKTRIVDYFKKNPY